MKNKLTLFALLMMMCSASAFADNDVQKEKMVTAKFSFLTGSATVADHYLSDQEYNGTVMGLSMDFGSFYKKSENLSWDLDITYFLSPYSSSLTDFSLANPAKTAFYSLHSFRADYGTYYNWNPVKNLYIKAGGSFDLLAGMIMGKPNQINNIIDLDFQTQFKAAAGVRYGWNFKKFDLFLQADVAVPFLGTALSSSPYSASLDNFLGSQILPGKTSVYHLTSFHNMKGFNLSYGVDFVFRKTTWFISTEINNRWWNLTGVQNYRLYNMRRIGVLVDLVAHPRRNSDNRYF